MASLPIVQFSLNGGELSPRMEARSDQNKRISGLSKCENWLPLTVGGVRRREGTVKAARCKVVADHPIKRIMPFRAGNDASYSLEFGHQYVRIFRNGLPITTDGPELIVNGGFNSNLSSWTDRYVGSGVSSWQTLSSEPCMKLEVFSDADVAAREQIIATVVGEKY